MGDIACEILHLREPEVEDDTPDKVVERNLGALPGQASTPDGRKKAARPG
jgi:hypothetical protein